MIEKLFQRAKPRIGNDTQSENRRGIHNPAYHGKGQKLLRDFLTVPKLCP